MISGYQGELQLLLNLNGELNRCGERLIKCKEDYILMQYIGFCNKNGKEIYEGDIIEEKSIYRVFIIKWDNEEARFTLVFQKGDNGKMGQIRHIIDVINMEIIGNIYENKDLLK